MSSAQVHHQRRLKIPYTPVPGAIRRDNKAQLYIFFTLYFVYYLFVPHDQFLIQFLSFTDERRAAPVQDTAQRRHRRRRAVGTRPKDSFQIKTLRKPFLLSLVDTHPLVL